MNETERSPAKERSPNYPSIGLPEALKDAKALWDREKRTVVDPASAARAWGYKSLSGPARTTIAALRQYGLLEAGVRGVALSDLAVDLIHQPEASESWAEAVRAAASSPDLFRELAATHANASDDTLRAYLITKKRFSEDGARRVIKSWRDTLALVTRVNLGYTEATEISAPSATVDMQAPATARVAQLIESPNVTKLHFILGSGMRAEVVFLGSDLGPAHISRLKDYLEITSKALAEDRATDGVTNRAAIE